VRPGPGSERHRGPAARPAQEAIVPIPNSDYVPDPFPGIRLPDGTGAPGTAGASGRAADDTPAGRVTLPQLGVWQEGARYDASTNGTVLAGQSEPSVITGGDGGYTDTGAGSGRASHFPRRDWQQGAS
jgi:hypothetical protein